MKEQKIYKHFASPDIPEGILPAMRKIELLVIHCSATRSNSSYPVSTLTQEHQKRFGKPGYHFYIERNGNMYQLLLLAEKGCHAKGFNHNSIGICYEGGLDEQGRPKDTRTDAQKQRIKELTEILKKVFPGVKVKGHCQLSPDIKKACPCFDAEKEYGK